MDTHWYCVAVEPHRERHVRDRADGLSIEAYYPVEKRLIRRRRGHALRLVEDEGPALPGYVFVRTERGHFAGFRRRLDGPEAVPHCLGLLGDETGPEALPEAAIADLKARQAAGEFDAAGLDGRYSAPRWLRPGARVMIVAGPMVHRLGEVWRQTRRAYVGIWVAMLGRTLLTEVPTDWVVRAR